MLVFDEMLGLELSNFSRQLKSKPGIDDDNQVIVGRSIDLWFGGMEFEGEERPRRQNAKEPKAHLEAIVLRMKPEANNWLQLTPRITALDAFERGPTMITNIHAYLVRELISAENEGEKSAEFIDRMCQKTLTRGILDAEH